MWMQSIMLHSIPYLGKNDSWPAREKLGGHVVLQLTKPHRKTGRNVTIDKFFTWVNLAKILRHQGINIVGTVNYTRK